MTPVLVSPVGRRERATSGGEARVVRHETDLERAWAVKVSPEPSVREIASIYCATFALRPPVVMTMAPHPSKVENSAGMLEPRV